MSQEWLSYRLVQERRADLERIAAQRPLRSLRRPRTRRGA
jgi:hypothetical protein